jgi:carboxylesterase type B
VAIKTIPFLVLMLLVGIASADSVGIEGGLIEGTVEDGLTVYRGIPFAAPAGATVERLYHGEPLAKKGVVVVTIGCRLGTLVFSEAKPQAMHFAHTAHAGPVVSEEGLKGLDVCLEWRRTAAADIK